MEVQQCMKLTGTNRSIGLIAQLRIRHAQRQEPACGYTTVDKDKETRFPFIDGLVVMAGVPAPDPIPNSVVKTPSADGTAS